MRDSSFIIWAGFGGILHLVRGHYRTASNALHHGTRDLERRFHVVEGDLDGIIVGPEQGDVGDLLLAASKLAFVGVERCAGYFDKEIPAAIQRLYDEHSRQAEAKAAAPLDGDAA